MLYDMACINKKCVHFSLDIRCKERTFGNHPHFWSGIQGHPLPARRRGQCGQAAGDRVCGQSGQSPHDWQWWVVVTDLHWCHLMTMKVMIIDDNFDTRYNEARNWIVNFFWIFMM